MTLGLFRVSPSFSLRHEKLKASNSNELTKLPSPLSISDDACATNSTSCETSILKENVELRAQLALLTSN
jgi:hypothetical protein